MITPTFLKSFQIIRILRVFRVLRGLRLIKIVHGLDKLLQTLSWSLPALSNVFILMIIMFLPEINKLLTINLYI